MFQLTRIDDFITYAMICFTVVIWCHYKWKRWPFEKLASKLPGIPSYPIIGSALQFIGTPQLHKWRRTRRLVAPAFNANFMNEYFPVFVEKYRILVRDLNKEVDKTQPFDLWDYLADTNVKINCQTMMGYNLDTRSETGSEFAAAIVKVEELMAMRGYKPWLHPDVIYSIYLKFRGLQNIFKTAQKLPNQVIKEMKETYDRNKAIDVTDGEKKRLKNYLDTLLELNNAGTRFSQDEIRNEIMTMMIAGSETSGLGACYCLLMLAIHPKIQDRVYDEIYSVLGDGDRSITIEDTAKLVYLEQVLKETLRIYPVVPVNIRQLEDDVEVASGNHILPKGTFCVLAHICTHRDAELYPNPLAFNPDNFDPENTGKRHRYSFIAFSGGPRGCIGSKYAMLSMKVLVSTFLRSYSVQTNVKMNDIKLKVDILLRSVNGYPVTIRARDRRPTYKADVKTLDVDSGS